MRKKIASFFVIASIMMLATSVYAHDPSEHNKKTEQPNCNVMASMDHSSMDMSDPVVQAMMKKCMGDMHEGDQHEEKNSNDDEDSHTMDDHAKQKNHKHGH